MKKILAVWITKFLIFAGKLAGKKGSSTPGAVALKICPDILKWLSGQVKGSIVAVCGTNGKTTTNNLLYSILKSQGKKVVCNNVGANMLEGVATTFISNTNFFGKLDADYACIEIDEVSTVKVFDHMVPNFMIITNLFRDQLDRYGEIDITIDFLKRAISKTGDITLILNADDPLVTAFGRETGKKCVYFGVGEDVGASLNETKEGRFCRFCGSELAYQFYHYSQLGNYGCIKCGFSRPAADFEALNVDLSDGLSFTVNNQEISVDYRGFYNIYNILAAYSAASLIGASLENVHKVLGEYKPQIGRMETFTIHGKPVILNLSKNPAGFNQTISTIASDSRKKDILVVINDNAQDGRDVSWLWDVDFERLGAVNASSFTASGIRFHDVLVRFKYAQLDNFSSEADVKAAILKCLEGDGEVLYVLVNYTVLFSTQKILKSLEGNK
ncbi:MAG: MurT ligase domain-containing protein [Eubacteriales bacterium]|jgi:UDP-N-acetylmuramyl tripeptide synthase|nr:MurT ligase domain-containing protein [Eubacteriales bacterium]